MTTSRAEVEEIIERDLIKHFTEMFRRVDSEETFHGRAREAIAYWRQLPRLERSLLCELMREQRIPPPVSAPSIKANHAHGLKREDRSMTGASNSQG